MALGRCSLYVSCKNWFLIIMGYSIWKICWGCLVHKKKGCGMVWESFQRALPKLLRGGLRFCPISLQGTPRKKNSKKPTWVTPHQLFRWSNPKMELGEKKCGLIIGGVDGGPQSQIPVNFKSKSQIPINPFSPIPISFLTIPVNYWPTANPS